LDSTQTFSNFFLVELLQEVLRYNEQEFIELAVGCPAVVCCRCSPEQKADVVKLIMNYTKKSVAAIGQYLSFLKFCSLLRFLYGTLCVWFTFETIKK
jgi:hypothetical protein